MSWKLFKKALWRVTFNSLVVNLAMNLTVYPVAVWRGASIGPDLPSFTTTIFHFLVFVCVYEPLFYYSHR